MRFIWDAHLRADFILITMPALLHSNMCIVGPRTRNNGCIPISHGFSVEVGARTSAACPRSGVQSAAALDRPRRSCCSPRETGDVDDDEEDDSAEGVHHQKVTSGASCTDVFSTFPISCPGTLAASWPS